MRNLVLYLTLILSTPNASRAADFMDSYFDNLQSIRICRLNSDQGLMTGRLAFRADFPSCAAYFYYAPQLGGYLRALRLPGSGAGGLSEVCYRSAWIRGYLQAHSQLWTPCLKDLVSLEVSAPLAFACPWQKERNAHLNIGAEPVATSQEELLDQLAIYLEFEDWARAWDTTISLVNLSASQTISCITGNAYLEDK